MAGKYDYDYDYDDYDYDYNDDYNCDIYDN